MHPWDINCPAEYHETDINDRGRNVLEYWGIRDLSISFEEAHQILRATPHQIPFEETYLPNYISIKRNVGFITGDIKIAAKMLKKRIDFVYDLCSGLWFFDMRAGHEILRGALYNYYTGKGAKSNREDREVAEAYVAEGFGIFRSTTSLTIWIGEDTQLTPQLKLMFKDYPIERLEKD